MMVLTMCLGGQKDQVRHRVVCRQSQLVVDIIIGVLKDGRLPKTRVRLRTAAGGSPSHFRHCVKLVGTSVDRSAGGGSISFGRSLDSGPAVDLEL